MDLTLQVWGGGCYLLNKILFAVSEGKKQKIKRVLKLYGWGIYILGVPAWVIILVNKQNWIAASIEAGGVPSMFLGLYTVFKNTDVPNGTFDKIASIFTYGSLTLGVSYSLHENGGISSLSQILEFGVMVGFLLGSYLLAKNSRNGWLFFMLMNGSMASLMFIQSKPLLAMQQLVSLGFVIYGFIVSGRTRSLQ